MWGNTDRRTKGETAGGRKKCQADHRSHGPYLRGKKCQDISRPTAGGQLGVASAFTRSGVEATYCRLYLLFRIRVGRTLGVCESAFQALTPRQKNVQSSTLNVNQGCNSTVTLRGVPLLLCSLATCTSLLTHVHACA